MFPFKLGETIPTGHNLKDPLPEVSSYLDGFAAWFAAVCWAFTKNNKKPITGTDGRIFDNTNWEPTFDDEDSAGEKVLRQVQRLDRQSYQFLIVTILSTSTAYKSSLVSTEISTSTKFNNYNFENPTTDPQVQQATQSDINANMISTIGTTIAASVAQVMTDNKKKKTFESERSTTMLGLYSSYSATDENGDKVLVPGKFKEEFEQVLNTKGKHKAPIGMQTQATASYALLSNLDKPSMISMYMDMNSETYNTVRVEKIKTFCFLDDSLQNTTSNYDSFITVFNYLRVELATNLAFCKMTQSKRVARQDAELKDDIKKRVAAPKLLFLDGEQYTLKDFMSLFANISFEFHMVYKYPEEGIIYKMVEQALKFLHSSQGRQWMASAIANNKSYLHSMICVLQNAMTSMIRIQCRNTAMITCVNNNEEVKNPVTIKATKFCTKNFVTNMKNKANAPAQGYKYNTNQNCGTTSSAQKSRQQSPKMTPTTNHHRSVAKTSKLPQQLPPSRPMVVNILVLLPSILTKRKRRAFLFIPERKAKNSQSSPRILTENASATAIFLLAYIAPEEKIALPSPRLC